MVGLGVRSQSPRQSRKRHSQCLEFTIWVLGACVLVCCDAFNIHLCTAPAGTMAHMTAPHPIVGLRTWTAHCQLADRLPLAGVLADGLLQVLTQQPSVLETDPVQLLALATALETCRPDWCQRWMRSDLQMERKIKNRLGGRRSHQKAQPWVDIQKTNVGDHTKTPACRWHRAQALSANAAMPRVIGWQLQCERQVSCLFVFVPPPNLTSHCCRCIGTPCVRVILFYITPPPHRCRCIGTLHVRVIWFHGPCHRNLRLLDSSRVTSTSAAVPQWVCVCVSTMRVAVNTTNTGKVGGGRMHCR